MYTIIVIAFVMMLAYTAYKGVLSYKSVICMDYDELERFEKLVAVNIFLLLLVIFYPERV